MRVAGLCNVNVIVRDSLNSAKLISAQMDAHTPGGVTCGSDCAALDK